MAQADVRCPICNLNLQILTQRKREEHCDACLDIADFGEPVRFPAPGIESAPKASSLKSEINSNDERSGMEQRQALYLPLSTSYTETLETESSNTLDIELCEGNTPAADADSFTDSQDLSRPASASLSVSSCNTDLSATVGGGTSSDKSLRSVSYSESETKQETQVDSKQEECILEAPVKFEEAAVKQERTSSSPLDVDAASRKRKLEVIDEHFAARDTAGAAVPPAGAKRQPSRTKRPMPFYKVLEFGDVSIAVDAFNYGAIPGVGSYYLSHFHADHYGGLTKSWSHGPIYCSPATARLVNHKLRVPFEYLRPIEADTEHIIDGISVVALDANHCPGAVVFLYNRSVLHTGDFRATKNLVRELRLFTTHLETVYLDTTYLDPLRKFPSQDLVVETCAQYCAEFQSKPPKPSFFLRTPAKRHILVIVGTYTIGKERLALAISERLNNKIWAQPWKQKVIETIGDPHLCAPLSNDGTEAQVHLVSMGDLSIAKLDQKWKFLRKHFTHMIAFVPTGWTWPKHEASFDLKMLENPKTNTVSHGGAIRLCRVPYSEHSSFSELEEFCRAVACKRLIATVHTKRYDILRGWEVK